MLNKKFYGLNFKIRASRGIESPLDYLCAKFHG
ncbi:hypothetical protein AVEN_112246-1, partial [Araneus ventricosus]